MSLTNILSTLEKTGLLIFTINDLKKITGLNEETIYVYVSRMLKKGYIYKIEKGKYSICQDPFIVSTQIVYPSYISFLTALYLHGKTTQTINEIFVATSKRKKEIGTFGMKIKFIKLNPKFMFGFKRIEKANGYIFLADLEKAIIDSLYLPRYCSLTEVFSALKDANIEKLLIYNSKLKIEAINRRLGYMFDLLGIKTDLKIRSKAVYKLNPSLKSLGKFNSKWRLYVNEVLV